MFMRKECLRTSGKNGHDPAKNARAGTHAMIC
jgi:hypothetical protein